MFVYRLLGQKIELLLKHFHMCLAILLSYILHLMELVKINIFKVLFLCVGEELMGLENIPDQCLSPLWIVRRPCHVLLVFKQPKASRLGICRQIS